MDKGHRETDRLIDDLEKRIQSVYSRAAKETQEKLDAYMESFKAKDKKKREEVAAGTLSKSDYAKWRTGQILIGQRWEEMVDTLSKDLANADKLAQSITQGYMYDAYALNHNYATFLVEQDSLVDTSYTLYDRHTVERLIKDEPNLLPAPTPGSKRDRELREGRIERWNAQKITSEVTQGILQGESVDKIASRMRNVAAMGSRAARRNARTAVTGAENAGRQAGFERAQDMGIDTEKQWLATMDDRTRHEHRLLDGVHVPVDEDFEVDGYKIEYPGDPSAEPEMVYNCRCTMICRIKGFEKDFTDRHNDALGDMTYEEWKHQLEKKDSKELRFSNAENALNDTQTQASKDYAERMSSKTLDKFNNVFKEAEYKQSDNGSYYDESNNIIYISKNGDKGETLFHESTHYHDFNQKYDIVDDWGRYSYTYDDDGNLISKEWISNPTLIKKNAGFSEYIAWNWHKVEPGKETSKMRLKNLAQVTHTVWIDLLKLLNKICKQSINILKRIMYQKVMQTLYI